jgi:hypothetical protein
VKQAWWKHFEVARDLLNTSKFASYSLRGICRQRKQSMKRPRGRPSRCSLESLLSGQEYPNNEQPTNKPDNLCAL